MAAKPLHSLADENPDLQKQNCCMTGIFQLFGRHTKRQRLPHKRLPAGSSHYNNGVYHPHAASGSMYRSCYERAPAKGFHFKLEDSYRSSIAVLRNTTLLFITRLKDLEFK